MKAKPIPMLRFNQVRLPKNTLDEGYVRVLTLEKGPMTPGQIHFRKPDKDW